MRKTLDCRPHSAEATLRFRLLEGVGMVMMNTFEKIICRAGLGLVLGGVLLSVVLTQDGAKAAGWPAQSSSSAASNITPADKQFMEEAADGGLAEVELGKLALRKANSHHVKDFGQRMITDHSAANQQIKKLAARKGVSIPHDLGKDNKMIRDRLEKLSGSQFDNAYMAEMLKDHKKDVESFRQQSRGANDNEVKNFAARTFPTLQSHLKEAEMIATDLTAGHARKKPSAAIAQTHQSTIPSKAATKAR